MDQEQITYKILTLRGEYTFQVPLRRTKKGLMIRM